MWWSSGTEEPLEAGRSSPPQERTTADDPLNLDEAGEWAGLWWLPDDPDEQVPGVLRYDPESGLSLSLIGAFEDRITSKG
ncbi:hypothetical protein [Streptomyces sp. NBC_00286]|uniref:ApeA N-terminal domain 1-containing protein n=1 Tax=Streptomyces sp. NBC_00286 TaxID=2975701 RepID=UPI003FA717A6